MANQEENRSTRTVLILHMSRNMTHPEIFKLLHPQHNGKVQVCFKLSMMIPYGNIVKHNKWGAHFDVNKALRVEQTSNHKYLVKDSDQNNDEFAVKSTKSTSEALYIYSAHTFASRRTPKRCDLPTAQWNEGHREMIREVIQSLTKPGMQNIPPVTIYMPGKVHIKLKVYGGNPSLLIKKQAWFQLKGEPNSTN
jgi:hypothetical protein